MNLIKTYFGTVIIIGRPNVGKSTLINKLLKEKLSIISYKPQTTRNLIHGIYTNGPYQINYIDTPGFNFKEKNLINKLMNRKVLNLINNVSLIILVVEEQTNININDKIIINKLHNINCPIILVINKIDNIYNKNILLPCINLFSKLIKFYKIIPISALNNININLLNSLICKILPIGSHFFLKNYITNCTKNFIISEIIREKLMYFLGNELPYTTAVKINYINYCNNMGYYINGDIIVECIGQKKIVIGKKGNKIRKISVESKKNIELIFNSIINIKLLVKIKKNWINNKNVLSNLGYF